MKIFKTVAAWLFLPTVVVAGYYLYRWIFGSASVDDKGNYTFSSTATRELRANNPLGVSKSDSFDWENVDLTRSVPGPDGVSIPGVDNKLGDMLMIFQGTQDGLNAAAWLLYARYFQADSNTPESLGNKWAGDSQNKANAAGKMSYGDAIASIMKDNPLAVISYGTDAVPVMKALAREENGTLPVLKIPDGMYLRAVAYGQS